MKEFEEIYSSIVTGSGLVNEMIKNSGNDLVLTDYAKISNLFFRENNIYCWEINEEELSIIELSNSKKDFENEHFTKSNSTEKFDTINDDICGIRPILNLNNSIVGYTGKYTLLSDDVYELEIGEYPQFAVNKTTQSILEKKYLKKELVATGNLPIKRFCSAGDSIFEYNGKKYTRICQEKNCFHNTLKLSNGQTYTDNDVIWFEIEPIKFLYFNKTNIVISKYIIICSPIFNEEYSIYNLLSDLKNYHLKNSEYSILPNFESNLSNVDLLNIKNDLKDCLLKLEEKQKKLALLENELTNRDQEFELNQKKSIANISELEKESLDKITEREDYIKIKTKELQDLRSQIETERRKGLSELESKLKLLKDNNILDKESCKNNYDDLVVPSFLKDRIIDFIPKERNLVKDPNDQFGFNYDFLTPEDKIKSLIDSNVSVFLHGPSSEGKSARVKQFDPNPVIIYLRNATPESINGKSAYDQSSGRMIDIPPTWFEKIKEKCENEPDKLHVVFFDEFTNALPAIQGFAFNIILDKEIDGKWILPKNARIVAAGNEVEDSLAAYEMVEPVYNRFGHVTVKTNANNWLAWAFKCKDDFDRLEYYSESNQDNKIHPAITSFIGKYGDSVLRTRFTGKEPNADPRRWEMASKILYSTNNPLALEPIIGSELTDKFINFVKSMENELINVINGKYDNIFNTMNISEKSYFANLLAEVGENDLIVARQKASMLGNECLQLFDSLWIGDNENRFMMIQKLRMDIDNTDDIAKNTGGLHYR